MHDSIHEPAVQWGSNALVLVTGSAGHLGEGLMRALPAFAYDARGVDLMPSPFTSAIGSIGDPDFLREVIRGVRYVIHSASLHKPHVATHSRQAFIDTNISGTLAILEASAAAGVETVVFTSTTSVYGGLPSSSSRSAMWITERTQPRPKNIYGVTKLAAEQLCELFSRRVGLPCIVLRVARFFLDPDDDPARRAAYADANLKVNEYLHRRIDLHDAVTAHVRALECGTALGFGRYLVTATTPFREEDAPALATDLPAVLERVHPTCAAVYQRLRWTMLPAIDRVYVNARARSELGWTPEYDFARVLRMGSEEGLYGSPLARAVGMKPYHQGRFAGALYPVES